jgi:hypothetical protein
LQCLMMIAPRPSSLAPAIFKITENSSTWKRKGICLFTLGSLYEILSRFTEGIKAFQAAEVLFLAASDHERIAICVIKRADVYTNLWRFIQSKRILENFEHSDSWEHLDKPTKVGIWFGLDVTRMHTFTSSVPELLSYTSLRGRHCTGQETPGRPSAMHKSFRALPCTECACRGCICRRHVIQCNGFLTGTFGVGQGKGSAS